MARKKKAVQAVKEDKPEPILEQPEERTPIGKRISKFAKIFFGVLIILGGLFLIWMFLPEFIKVLEGLVGVMLILIGLLVAALGWLD
jgi:hypothetical protein